VVIACYRSAKTERYDTNCKILISCRRIWWREKKIRTGREECKAPIYPGVSASCLDEIPQHNQKVYHSEDYRRPFVLDAKNRSIVSRHRWGFGSDLGGKLGLLRLRKQFLNDYIMGNA
jgi:hypothetical protein